MVSQSFSMFYIKRGINVHRSDFYCGKVSASVLVLFLKRVGEKPIKNFCNVFILKTFKFKEKSYKKNTWHRCIYPGFMGANIPPAYFLPLWVATYCDYHWPVNHLRLCCRHHITVPEYLSAVSRGNGLF